MRRDMRPVKDLVFLANRESETCEEVLSNPNAEDAGNQPLSIGFKTDDVEKKRDELVSAGHHVTPMISPTPNVKFFFVKDPAGANVKGSYTCYSRN